MTDHIKLIDGIHIDKENIRDNVERRIENTLVNELGRVLKNKLNEDMFIAVLKTENIKDGEINFIVEMESLLKEVDLKVFGKDNVKSMSEVTRHDYLYLETETDEFEFKFDCILSSIIPQLKVHINDALRYLSFYYDISINMGEGYKITFYYDSRKKKDMRCSNRHDIEIAEERRTERNFKTAIICILIGSVVFGILSRVFFVPFISTIISALCMIAFPISLLVCFIMLIDKWGE